MSCGVLVGLLCFFLFFLVNDGWPGGLIWVCNGLTAVDCNECAGLLILESRLVEFW